MNNDVIEIRLFVSGRFKQNRIYQEQIEKELSGKVPKVEVVNIDCGESEWRSLGLRSVPAIVFFRKGRPIGNIVRYASSAEILLYLDQLKAAPPEDEFNVLDRIAYDVVESTGCHRYERWNEQFLCAGDGDGGWAAPNRKDASHETLVLELRAPAVIKKICFRPRFRNDGTPSYRSFPSAFTVTAKTVTGEFVELLRLDRINPVDVTTDMCCAISSTNEIVSCTVTITEKNAIDGKSFPAFARIRLYGSYSEGISVRSHFVRKCSFVAHPEIFYKSGLIADKNLSVIQIHLQLGQTIPASASGSKTGIYVIAGMLQLTLGSETVQKVPEGAFVVVDEHVSISAKGLEGKTSLIWINGGLDVPSLWEAR